MCVQPRGQRGQESGELCVKMLEEDICLSPSMTAQVIEKKCRKALFTVTLASSGQCKMTTWMMMTNTEIV